MTPAMVERSFMRASSTSNLKLGGAVLNPPELFLVTRQVHKGFAYVLVHCLDPRSQITDVQAGFGAKEVARIELRLRLRRAVTLWRSQPNPCIEDR
jgi:hypothetical protein